MVVHSRTSNNIGISFILFSFSFLIYRCVCVLDIIAASVVLWSNKHSQVQSIDARRCHSTFKSIVFKPLRYCWHCRLFSVFSQWCSKQARKMRKVFFNFTCVIFDWFTLILIFVFVDVKINSYSNAWTRSSCWWTFRSMFFLILIFNFFKFPTFFSITLHIDLYFEKICIIFRQQLFLHHLLI